MKFPIMFIGHGSPMNAIEDNMYTKSWSEIGKSITETPRAILMLSAHWITPGVTRINTGETPEMIYDMYGFPEPLYRLKYSAPGSGALAQEIIAHFSGSYEIFGDSGHGFDHGAWSVLVHLFPEAKIPVIQLSLDYAKPSAWHFEFGKKLKNLREQGILIIGSGNIVHNLREIDWSDSGAFQWAEDFDARVEKAILSQDYHDVLGFQAWGKISTKAHPTFDHFLPLLPLLGAVDESDKPEFYTPEITMGSLAMRSIVWR